MFSIVQFIVNILYSRYHSGLPFSVQYGKVVQYFVLQLPQSWLPVEATGGLTGHIIQYSIVYHKHICTPGTGCSLNIVVFPLNVVNFLNFAI